MRDYYRCEDCGKRFFKVETAVNHKVATGHKIVHVFADTVREAFV